MTLVTEQPKQARRMRLPASRPVTFLSVTRVVSFLVAAAIVVPLISTLWRLVVNEKSLTFSTIADTWQQPGTAAMIRNTLVMVVASTISATIIASFFAWLNERTNARMGWVSEILPMVPFFVPPLAGAIGWVILAEPNVGVLNSLIRSIASRLGVSLGDHGPINVYSWPGLIFVTTLYLVPHVYLVIAAALRNVDPALEEAARVSGAGRLRTLLRVTLPAITPSIISGMLLALVVGFALYSVPVLIATGARIDILSVRIVRLMVTVYPPQVAQAVVLCFVMLVFILSASMLQAKVTRGGKHATIGGRFGRGDAIDLGGFRWLARGVMILYLLASSVLPFVGLVVLSLQRYWSASIDWATLNFSHYRSLFNGSDSIAAMPALRHSIVLGAVGATTAMLIAAMVTYYVSARSSTRVGRSINNIVKLPGAITHIVIALALIASFAGPPFSLGGTFILLFIGYLIMYMPQATVTASSAYHQVDRYLNEASRSSGASQFRTFRKVTLPLMTPGLATGWVFVFILIVGDLTGSVMLASTSTPVLGTVLLGTFQSGSYSDVAALSVIATVIPGLIALTVLVLARRIFGLRRHDKVTKSIRDETALLSEAL